MISLEDEFNSKEKIMGFSIENIEGRECFLKAVNF
jgi:hypothetical protein